MVVMTLWASLLNEITFIQEQNWLLTGVNGLIILLVVLIVIEGTRTLLATRPEPAYQGFSA
jgi:hypothetical protein